MPERFVVPQFIESEDKILGPITVRQFLILLIATFILFIEYRLLSTASFIISGLLTAGLAGTFGFLKVYGVPFHLFFVNVLQTLRRPALRVWRKEPTEAELRIYLEKKEKITPLPPAAKPRPESTRLRDLALTVNTGGVYNPEEES